MGVDDALRRATETWNRPFHVIESNDDTSDEEDDADGDLNDDVA